MKADIANKERGRYVIFCTPPKSKNAQGYGTVSSLDETVLAKINEQFGLALPRPVDLVYLRPYLSKWLDGATYPFATLLWQTVIGGCLLFYECAIVHSVPALIIESVGIPMLYPLLHLIAGCRVVAYIHYPIVSSRMADMVHTREVTLNNRGPMAKYALFRWLKLVYYWVFMQFYRFLGQFPDLVLTNSSWTDGHVRSLWRPRKTHVLFPPCRVDQHVFRRSPAEGKKISKPPPEVVASSRRNQIVSLGQFRPEKNHALQLRAFSAAADRLPVGTTLVLVGGARNEEDLARVEALKELSCSLGIEKQVEFRVNASYEDVQRELATSLVGLHTMRDEHFGIGIVEYMAAGCIVLAHHSGGVALDIVSSSQLGFLADNDKEYADAMVEIFRWRQEEPRRLEKMRAQAMAHALSFDDAVFQKSFVRWLEPIAALAAAMNGEEEREESFANDTMSLEEFADEFYKKQKIKLPNGCLDKGDKSHEEMMGERLFNFSFLAHLFEFSTFNMPYRSSEAKKEEFRKYLESSQVVDALTRVLVNLYEEPDRPEDPVEYVKKVLGGASAADYEALQQENARLRAEVESLKKKVAEQRPHLFFFLNHIVSSWFEDLNNHRSKKSLRFLTLRQRIIVFLLFNFHISICILIIIIIVCLILIFLNVDRHQWVSVDVENFLMEQIGGSASTAEQQEDVTKVHYPTPWPAYGLSWGARDSERMPFRFAISSYLLDYKNYIHVIERNSKGDLVRTRSYEHCYPPTKIMFPPKPIADRDVFITTADFLRVWNFNSGRDGSADADALVFKSGSSACTPITSCDWNSDDLNIVGCCSVDRVVTIWDLEAKRSKKQVMTNEKEVYDIAFNTAQTFATCSADGSVRLFDLRHMEHSTILYESAKYQTPLLRIAWNRQDANYISTFGIDSPEAIIIDVRYPANPVTVLAGRHSGPINGMAWSPQSAQNICTVGEDGAVCIWDANTGESLFQHQSADQINNVAWSSFDKDWIAVTKSSGAQLLRF
eukprot:gene5472-3947_t